MTQGHKGSILPQKGGVSPIDSNTVFYAPYDDGVRDIVKGTNPIGSTHSLSLNGNNTSHVSISNLSFLSTGSTSIAMWVNPTSWTHTAHAAILSTRPNTSNGIMIFKLSGMSTINIDYGGSAQRFDTGYLPPLNKWTHIAYTHDGTTGCFYVNGILHRTTPLGSAVNASKGSEMKIGTDLVDLNYAYKGEVYDVIIANKVFTKEEIARIMTQPDTVSGFSARWLLNENDGIIAYDYSSGGNDGIISNGTWANGMISYSIVDDGFHEGYLDRKKPTKNLVSNPFFLNNAESWINNSGTIVIDETAPYSSNTLKLTSNGTHIMRLQDKYGLNHGTYTYSYYVRLYDDFVSGVIGALVYIYYTDGTVQTSVYNQPDKTKINEWQRIESTFTTNTAKTISYIRLYGPWSNNMIGSFGATAVQLEESSYATEFVVDSRSRNESKGRALLIEEGTTNLIDPDGFTGDANFKVEKLDKYTFKVTLLAIPPTNGYYVQQIAPAILANQPATMSVEVLEMSNPAWTIGISGWGIITGTDGFKIGNRHIRTITHTTNWPYSISLGYVGDVNRASLKVGDYIIARNAQVEQKPFATSFVDGIRPKASLSYSKELINPAVFTFSAWVKLNAMPSKAGLVPSGLAPIFEVSNGIVGTNRLLFGWLASNELVIWRSNLVGAENSGLRTSSIFNSTDVGVWRFYAATFDGTTYKVYVDGKLVGSMRMSPATYHPSSNLDIGGSLHGKLNGSIDEVRIDKVARTLEEIQAWYYQGRNGV